MKMKTGSIRLAILCLACVVTSTSSFNMPSLSGFLDSFSDYFGKKSEEVEPVVERKKRQTSQIGDESSLMYEIRSSRLDDCP